MTTERILKFCLDTFWRALGESVADRKFKTDETRADYCCKLAAARRWGGRPSRPPFEARRSFAVCAMDGDSDGDGIVEYTARDEERDDDMDPIYALDGGS